MTESKLSKIFDDCLPKFETVESRPYWHGEDLDQSGQANQIFDIYQTSPNEFHILYSQVFHDAVIDETPGINDGAILPHAENGCCGSQETRLTDVITYVEKDDLVLVIKTDPHEGSFFAKDIVPLAVIEHGLRSRIVPPKA